MFTQLQELMGHSNDEAGRGGFQRAAVSLAGLPEGLHRKVYVVLFIPDHRNVR